MDLMSASYRLSLSDRDRDSASWLASLVDNSSTRLFVRFCLYQVI